MQYAIYSALIWSRRALSCCPNRNQNRSHIGHSGLQDDDKLARVLFFEHLVDPHPEDRSAVGHLCTFNRRGKSGPRGPLRKVDCTSLLTERCKLDAEIYPRRRDERLRLWCMACFGRWGPDLRFPRWRSNCRDLGIGRGRSGRCLCGDASPRVDRVQANAGKRVLQADNEAHGRNRGGDGPERDQNEQSFAFFSYCFGCIRG